MPWSHQHILSIKAFSKADICMVLEEAARLKRNPDSTLLAGKVLATLFFEPSTRTRLSFTFAMQRLGGAVAGFADPSVSSTKKGETLADTIRMVSGYADAIVMRHPQEGAARWASEVSSVPIINAGDGANQHPTQTLLDLFTIEEAHGKIDGLHIAMVGDLKYGRTVHSLAEALSHYNVTISFVAPNSLQMPKHVLEHLEEKHISYHLFERIEDVIDQADVLYMTRIQQERFPDPVEYERLKHCFHLHPELVAKGKSELSILHPLPRITEIDPRVDALPQAKYFQQAKNGLFVRQALLRFLLAQ